MQMFSIWSITAGWRRLLLHCQVNSQSLCTGGFNFPLSTFVNSKIFQMSHNLLEDDVPLKM